MKVWQKIFASQRNLAIISIITIFLMIFSSYLGYVIATNFGSVAVKEVSIIGSKDNVVSAFLFQPSSATPTNKAPAVFLAYGGTGLKDFMVNTAIELARRGFVALTIDTGGGGYSESTSSNVGVDALTYLRSQSFVDVNNIGLVGMSFGAMTTQAIARAQPDWYKSMFFMGIIPIFMGPADVAKLKNIAVEVGSADECAMVGMSLEQVQPYMGPSQLLHPYWRETVLAGLNYTGPIQAGVVYGNITAGTGRIIYTPWNNHPQTTESTESIRNVVEWMTLTLGNPKGNILSYDNMIFPWKQFFLSISFIAMIVFMFTSGEIFVQSEYFKDIVEPLPEYKGLKGIRYWIGAIITTAIGPILFMLGWFSMPPSNIGFTAIFPFGFTNQYAGWMLLVAIVTALILVVVYCLSIRKVGFTFKNAGLAGGPHKIVKSLVAAVLICGVLYTVVTFCYGFFKLPITLSGPQIPILFRPLNDLRAPYMINYSVLFLPFYLVLAVLFFGFIRPKEGNISLFKECVINSLVLSIGSVIYLLFFYVPLYSGRGYNTLFVDWSAAVGNNVLGLVGISSIYFIPVPIFNVITACVLTYFNRKTGSVWLGALLMTLFFTWMQVSTCNFGGAVI